MPKKVVYSCPSCGASLKKDAEQCRYCGSDIFDLPEKPVEMLEKYQPKNEVDFSVNETSEDTSYNYWAYLFSAVLFIVTLFVSVHIFEKRGKKNLEDAVESTRQIDRNLMNAIYRLSYKRYKQLVSIFTHILPTVELKKRNFKSRSIYPFVIRLVKKGWLKEIYFDFTCLTDSIKNEGDLNFMVFSMGWEFSKKTFYKFKRSFLSQRFGGRLTRSDRKIAPSRVWAASLFLLKHKRFSLRYQPDYTTTARKKITGFQIRISFRNKRIGLAEEVFRKTLISLKKAGVK